MNACYSLAMRRARMIALGIFAAIVLAGAHPMPRFAETIAVVVRIQGDVRLQRADAPGSVPVGVGMGLEADDRLVLAPGAEATLLYRSGKLIRAATSLTLAKPSEGPDDGLFTRAMRTMTQVAATDVRQQPNRQGMIRPIPGAAVAISPRNGILVRGPHPTFTWTAVPGARAYRVQIQPEAGQPVRYAASADTVWTLPAADAPLAPGAYTWTVAAAPRGRPADAQRFRVASAAERASLDLALQAIAATGLDPDDDGLLLAALAYRDAGFLYDARDALGRLAAGGVRLGREVYLLRAEVLDALGDLEGSATALMWADSATGPGS